MITKVEVRNAQGDLMTLTLEETSTGVVVQSIEGLDPVKATLVSSSFAQLDGSQYQSSRRESRNLKFQLGLEPDYVDIFDVRTLRNQLYGFFMPKTPVDLRFFLPGGLDVDISGRVESFETAIFSREPAVDVSILCFDPDFYDATPVVVAGNTTSTTTETTITYDGTVETGIIFTLNVNRTLDEFTIYHTPPDDQLRMLDFAAPLVSGDVLTISTVPGSKGATLTHLGSNSSILYGVSPQSKWIELMPGDNKIRVYATGAAVPYTIEYTDKYGGL
jgi:hypothetical protein